MRFLLRQLLLLAFFCAPMLQAQAEITVTSTVTQQQLVVGDQAQLAIQVRGATRLAEQPQIEIPGLEIEPAGVSNMQMNINGQVQIFATYTYVFSPTKAGEFEIPALDVPVEGQVYKTQPIKLKVTDSPAPTNPADDPFQPILKLETSKSEVFESEVVGLTITLLIHRGVNLRELPFPNLPRENFAMKRFQRNPENNTVQLNGQIYTAFYFRTSVSAIKSGDLVLGPAEVKVELDVPDGTGRRDMFGFMSSKAKRYTVKSDPLMMKVKPLPEAGKPANFSGAVGKFTTQIQAQPLKVMQGDPIAATLYINGVGNFESLSAPEIESKEGWRLYAAKQVQENRSTGLEPGSVVYSQVLIPDKVQTQIPSFSLNYFNPDTARYEVAKTDVIPVQVMPNANVPAAAGGTGETGIRDFSFEDKSQPKEALNGVLSVLRTPGGMAALNAAPFTLRYPWLVHGLGAVALIGILAAAFMKRLRSQQSVKQVAVAAPAKAADLFSQLKSEQSSLRQFYSVAASFIQAKQREQGREVHAGTPQAEVAQRVLMRRDFYNYGSAEAASQRVPDSEYQEVLDALKQF